MVATDSRVFDLHAKCRDVFSKYGIGVGFDSGTNPRKTYQWRYLVHFAQKIDEWQLDDDTAMQLVEAMLEYSKKNGKLRRGLSILSSGKILDIGYKHLMEKQKFDDLAVARLRSNAKFFAGAGDPCARAHRAALPNIVMWYMQGKLSAQFIAVSKKCRRALSTLNAFERGLLPDAHELLLHRIRLDDISWAKDILKDDWRGA